MLFDPVFFEDTAETPFPLPIANTTSGQQAVLAADDWFDDDNKAFPSDDKDEFYTAPITAPSTFSGGTEDTNLGLYMYPESGPIEDHKDYFRIADPSLPSGYDYHAVQMFDPTILTRASAGVASPKWYF